MADGIFNMMPGALSPDQGTQLMGASNQFSRDQAINAGLIGAGAGLLGAPNLRTGLANALTGFNKAYDVELLANRPKVTPLANGAFSQISFPDGRVEVVKNTDVERFLKEQQAMSLLGKQQLAELQANLGVEKGRAASDIKAGEIADTALREARAYLDQFKQGLSVVSQQGTWAQVQSLPFIRGIANFFGSKDSAGNLLLNELKVNEALRLTAQTKGAISNTEMTLFLSPTPDPGADREKVWKPWIENKISVLEKLIPILEAEKLKGETATAGARPGAATASPVAPAGSSRATPLPSLKTGDPDIDKYIQ